MNPDNKDLDIERDEEPFPASFRCIELEERQKILEVTLTFPYVLLHLRRLFPELLPHLLGLDLHMKWCLHPISPA